MRVFNASVGRICKLCDRAFLTGEKSVLLSLDPVGEELEKKNAGKPFITEAVEVHLSHVESLVREL